MRARGWLTIRTFFAVAAIPLAAHAGAQAPDTTCFVTMQGKDTVSIEQHVRVGNTITGAWIQNQGGVYVHDYVMVLGKDGWPLHYVMTLYTSRPHTFLMSVTYGPDSATRIMVRDSVAVTERVVAHKAYTSAALSILGMELALARARASHTDSSSIAIDFAERRGPPQTFPVKFFGGDSVRVGAAIEARVDKGGRLLALRTGPQETRRVPSLDAAKLTAGFIAADAAARAARLAAAISLSPAALQRLVGEYALGPTATAAVTFDGSKLMMRIGAQPAIQLLPASATKFFVESTAALTFEFETDAAGNVTALTAVQGDRRQRAPKVK